MDLKSLEKIFDIKISDESIYKKALTHPSYTKENSINSLENYERLEFLGDAVLKLAVSNFLYKKYPKSNEGDLSKIRSIMVSDEILSQIAKGLKLDALIILGKNAEKTGERNRASIIACVFEALLGAFYLDGKTNELFIFLNKICENNIKNVKDNLAKYHAKEILQEYTQGLTKEVPKYKIVKELGPAHEPKFEVEVLYQDKVLASAIGTSKKDAEQKCAYSACLKLGVINGK